VVLYLIIAVTILLVILAAIVTFFLATVHITFTDASGETIPTRFTDVFKTYLVEYPDEKDSEYIELAPGVEEDVPSGIYHLQVYCNDDILFPKNNRPPESKSKGILLYDEEISLPGVIFRNKMFQHKEVQLDSVYIQHYEIQVTPLGHGYLLEKPRDKIIVRTKLY